MKRWRQKGEREEAGTKGEKGGGMMEEGEGSGEEKKREKRGMGERCEQLSRAAGNGARQDHEHIAKGAKLHVDVGPTSCL